MTRTIYIDLENKYGAHNYHPLPVVLTRGKGCPCLGCRREKNTSIFYLRLCVNQGHCHPKRLLKHLIDQVNKLTLTSRAFYNDQLGLFEQKTP
jgi:ornithine--oxo-acid transaminase